MTSLYLFMAGLIMGVIAGILIGRANPKKADKLADYASRAKAKAEETYKDIRG